MTYDPTEYDKDTANEQAYDQAMDNFLTGDIHLLPEVFLFSTLQKCVHAGKFEMLNEISLYELNQRREACLLSNPPTDETTPF